MFWMERGRGIGAILTAALLFGLLAPAAWAQKRIFARVEPNIDQTDQLNFDVNVDGSDNIAPNIIFSKDNKQGFVAYAGSGTVLVFALDSGAVLARIKTGGKPSQATLLADGSTLAVVSVLEDKIFIIDMNSMTLANTFTFSGAKFGFGSILSLSPDGRFGYISSTGTAEVIKFNIADGKEVTRLKGLQAPAQITVSQDGASLMVVDALLEELVFLDAENLTRKQYSLKGKDASINFTIFNKAVLSPDGTTGIIASRDINGILGADTLFHFRTSNGEIIKTAVIGSEPGFTTLTPDGQNWVVFNDFSLTIVDTADFGNQRELSLVRGESLGSANVVFSPDSRYAIYLSSGSDLVFQHDLTTGAVVGQLLVGDNPNDFLDQPGSVAITPDGKTIAVLDFVSNNIELITDAWVLEAAKFISSAEKFTGISLVNFSGQETKFTLYALNNFGELMTGENVLNPAEFKLPANHQVSLTVAEIFFFDNAEERVGWLAVLSDQPNVAGYVSMGDSAFTTLDGAPMFSAPLFDWIVPETIRKEGKTVELNLVNGYFNQANYDVTRYSLDGSVAETRITNVAFPTNRHPQVFGEVFPDPEEVTDGYLRLTSDKGLLHTEFFGSDSALGALNGIDMEKFVGVKTIYSPQFAVLPTFKTVLNLINGSQEEAEVTITLHAPNGRVIGAPFKKTLAANEQLKEDLAFLFREEPEVVDVSGWLEIQSTQDRVVGTVTFTNNDETFLTSFELAGTPLSKFLFPVVAQNELYQTGMALLNPHDEPALVTLELWGTGGSLDRETSFTLAPKTRTALYLNDYFPNLEARLGGHLRVRSDRPVVSFSLINDKDFNFLTALPPIPMP